MASLLASLPQPRQHHAAPAPAAAPAPTSMAIIGREPPPYPKRAGFVPRKPEDFGDGGAYPEVHVAQYPLDMGRGDATRSGKTLAVSVGVDGEASYEAILRQGSNRDKIIHSDHKAIVPKLDLMDPKNLQRPDEEEEEKVAKETWAALQKVVDRKLAAVQPSTIAPQPGAPQLIDYVPSQQGAQYASGAGRRAVKVYDMPVDPLEPPKFRHTKVPRGTGSPPVPVMHSPPRPVSAQDQANWKIPPCISNWKNAKGYTIPLDKRLAADGRGLQEVTISDKRASLTEALMLAEAKAREAVNLRAKVQQEMVARQKAAKEAELRQLAAQARMERHGHAPAAAFGAGGGGAAPAAAAGGGRDVSGVGAYPPPPPAAAGGEEEDRDRYRERERGGRRSSSSSSRSRSPRGRDERGRHGSDRHRHRDHADDDDRYHNGGGASRGGRDERDEYRETAEEREARRRRDEIREERRRERERERRLEAKDGAGPAKKSKLTRDRERDIGEKMALGQAKVAGGAGEVQYDSRLFNQEQGLGTGFGAEDSYHLYDKPLFSDRGSSQLYRPNKAADDELYGGEGGGGAGGIRTEKFKADRGFQGAADPSAPGAGGGRGGGGVQYESAAQEADPFGLEQFMSKVNQGGRGRRDDE